MKKRCLAHIIFCCFSTAFFLHDRGFFGILLLMFSFSVVFGSLITENWENVTKSASEDGSNVP